MRDQERVEALIERVIAGAGIPSRAGRDDLRRELSAHFEDAGTSPEAVRDAIDRFGAEALVADSLRCVYRRDYLLLYLAKIAASIIASIAVALAIEVLVHLRVEPRAEVWRLSPGFPYAAAMSVAVVLGLVTAWEVGRRPFSGSRAAVALVAYATVCALLNLASAESARTFVTAAVLVVLGYGCSKLELRPARLLLTFGAFAAAEYGMHLALSVTFGASRALVAGAVLATVWTCTVLILARADQAFVGVFDPADRRPA